MTTYCNVKVIELRHTPAQHDVECGVTVEEFFRDVLNKEFVQGEVTINGKAVKADTEIDSDCDIFIAQMAKGNNETAEVEVIILGGGASMSTMVSMPNTVKGALESLNGTNREKLEASRDGSYPYMFSINGRNVSVGSELPTTTSGKVRIIASKAPKGNE